MTHVLVVSIGHARALAIRNLLFSFIRLFIAILISVVARDIILLLIATLLFDIAELIFFGVMIKNSGCAILPKHFNPHLIRQILRYCVPMAVFTLINALNRDLDKYLIALLTDTETLAIYSNASKPLPFDIITSAFCTVLVPHITKRIANHSFDEAALLYKRFLKISYISIGIFCCTALVVAPQLLQLLYSEKYLSGLNIFYIYTLVDLLRFTNITLILSAAGKTRTLMFMGLGSLCTNAVLNILLYHLFGIVGPAISTLLVTLLFGLVIMHLNAKVLHVHFSAFLETKIFVPFILESFVLTCVFSFMRNTLMSFGWHYLLILFLLGGAYASVMALLNGKTFLESLKQLNCEASK